MIEELIDTTVILESLASPDKDAAIDEMLAALVAAGRLKKADAPRVGERIREREGLGSTGIGNGVAVPHVKTDRVGEIAMALGRSTAGIEYQAIDGRAVHTVFLIVAPTDRADDHLKTLRWVSMLARNPDFRRFVLSAAGEPEIRDLLREMSAST